MGNILNKHDLLLHIKDNYDANQIKSLNINTILRDYTAPKRKIIAVLDPTKLDTEPLSNEEVQAGYKLIIQCITQVKTHQKQLERLAAC